MRDGEEFAGRSRPSEPDLSGQASAAGTRFTNLVHLATVDSTNNYAAEAYRTGTREGLVVIADEQTAGRGRRGRSWHSPPGSALLCSLLFCPPMAIEDLHLLTSAVALSASEAIQATSGLVCALKWPNDLLVGGKKLAGLLAELVTLDGSRSVGLVVGIGVNLSWPAAHAQESTPELAALAANATSLQAAGGLSASREVLLVEFLSILEVRYQLVLANEGHVLMDEYRLACSTIGQRVRVAQETRTFDGVATGVLDDGRLVVAHDGAEERIDTADVVHLTELGRR